MQIILEQTIKHKIPLPQIFRYLDKSFKQQLITQNLSKFEQLKQQIKGIPQINVDFIQLDQNEVISERMKIQLYTQLVRLIYNSNCFIDNDFYRCTNKLIELFEIAGENQTVKLVQQLKLKYENNNNNWDYIKKQHLLKVIHYLIATNQAIFEFIYALQFLEIEKRLSINIILDKTFIRTLKKNNLFQQVEPCDIQLSEEQLIIKMLEILMTQKIKDNNEVINQEIFINQLMLCERYESNQICKLFLQLFGFVREIQNVSSQQLKQGVRDLKELSTNFLIKTCFDFAIRNNMVIPQVLVCIGSRQKDQYQSQLYVNHPKGILEVFLKTENFQELTEECDLAKYLKGYYGNSEFFKNFYNELKNKTRFNNSNLEPLSVLIYKMLVLVDSDKEQQIMKLTKCFLSRNILLLLKNIDRSCDNIHYKQSIDLILRIKDYVTVFQTNKDIQYQEKMNNQQSLEGPQKLKQPCFRPKSHKATLQSSEYKIKFFPTLFKQNHTTMLDYTEDQRSQAKLNVSAILRLLVSQRKPVVEFLRYISFKNIQSKTRYVQLVVANQLIIYLEKSQTFQCFLRKNLKREDEDFIRILDFRYTDLRVDPSIALLSEPEIIVQMVILCYTEREKYISELIEIFQSDQVIVLLENLQSYYESNDNTKYTVSRDVAHYMLELNQYVTSYQNQRQF